MNNNQKRQNESGNVLFLILIAVALFAALSYAVTQSTRSGSGTTERETVLLNSAGLTQYPTTLRTAVVRMILAGFDIGEIGFDSPTAPSFGGVSARNQVFHPQGGGAVFQDAPLEVMAANQPPTWFYNGNFEVAGIGQDDEGGNDLIAFLPGVTVGVCRRLNEELGVRTIAATPNTTGVPDFNGDNNLIRDTHMLGETFLTEAAAGNRISNVSGANDDFRGQPAACFRDSDIIAGGGFVFYSVLLER